MTGRDSSHQVHEGVTPNLRAEQSWWQLAHGGVSTQKNDSQVAPTEKMGHFVGDIFSFGVCSCCIVGF